MSKASEVWKAVCDEVAVAMTPSGGEAPEVIRTYNAQTAYLDVPAQKILVVLTGQSREQTCSRSLWDVYEFSVLVLEPFTERTHSAQMEHLDNLLEIIPTLADHFSMKRIVRNDIEMIFNEQAVTIGNRPYELDELVDQQVFSFEMGLTVRVTRSTV